MKTNHKCFSIMQISSGWIMGEIKNQDHSILIDASYITNFTEHFMVALLYVLGRWPEDEHRDTFRVEHEPAQSKWSIKLENENLIFREITYKNSNSNEVIQDSTVIIEKETFLIDFIDEMQAVLERFGLFGYRQEWGYEFPLSCFLQLKDIANKTEQVIGSKRDGEDNLGMEYESTDFKNELKMMLPIVEPEIRNDSEIDRQ